MLPDRGARTGLTLRVCVPDGPLPHWLGELLLGLDQRARLVLQLQRGAAPPPAAWWEQRLRARVPALRDWRPSAAAQQRLASWEQPTAAVPDIVLCWDAASLPDAVAGPAPAPVHWRLRDGHGQALCWRWPLLTRITAGEGIALQCEELDRPGGTWRLRRRLHVAAPARYARGLDGWAPALDRLLEQALAALQLQARLDAPPEVPVPVPVPGLANAAARRPPVLRCLAQGGTRGWLTRQRARWLSESWRVGLIDAPVDRLLQPGPLPPVRWLTTPSAHGYWADPFGLPGDATRLNCEYFDAATGVGRIELLTLDAARPASPPARQPVAVGDGRHVSFAQVIELDGRRFGLAETAAMRQCHLHEVEAAGTWRPLWPLLQGVAAADPVLFRWQGRYWLAYTDADLGEHDNLCLQHAERLEGPWQPHANNPVKVDIRGARMAGGVFVHDGQLYRPGQDCLHTYGGGAVLHRIEHLSPVDFEERTVRRLAPEPHGPCPDGLHTVSAWGARTLIDGKRLAFEPLSLWRKLDLRLTSTWHRWSTPAAAGLTASASARPSAGSVFVYVPHLRTGGGELSMLQLAQGFAAAGRSVTLVVHTLRTQELPVPPGVRLLSLDRPRTAGALWQLVRVLRAQRPQWLLSAFPHTNVAAVVALALARCGTRGVLSEHAPLSQQISQQGGWRYRLLPPLLRWAYPRAAAVVAVSGGVGADLQRLVGPALQPLVIGNPVLRHGFEAEMVLPADHPWLCDPALQVVLSVCRLSPEKDLPTLLAAFAELHRTRPATRLLLAGEGPERERLQARIAELGLSAVVQLPGRTAQPLRWMHRAAVFVLASRFEGFGNVLIEALACGTPVVATDCPVGPRELLDGGRYGALVPIGDVAAMAQAIGAALADRTLPAGAHAAALQYTQARASAAYLRLFDERAQGRQPVAEPTPRPSAPARADVGSAGADAAGREIAAAAAAPAGPPPPPRKAGGVPAMVRHMLHFLPAQLISPAAQLISMVLWTHYLVPAQMGIFTLVTVAQEIVYTLCLAWFSIYALRYVPRDDDLPAMQRFLGTENAVVLGSVLASLLAGLVVALTLPEDGLMARDALVVGLYFATRGINAHYAERARAQSAFGAYTLLQTAGPVGAIGLALLAFEYFEPDAFVLLAAYAAAQALGTAVALPFMRMHWRLVWPDPAYLRAAVVFGGPVLGLAVLGWIAENHIRYLVQWQAGAASLGLMIVGWSLGRRCAAVATMLVATAAFPLASRLLNEGRRPEALAQLGINAVLVLGVLAPVTAALAFLGPALVSLAVAAEYREITAELLGWSVLGGALRNLHLHVTDQLMVLERRLGMVAVIDVIEIVLCAIATLAGLLLAGLPGAVAGQALGSLLTLGVSVRWADRHLGLVWPLGASLRILAATAVMAAGLWGLHSSPDLSGLLVGTLTGTLLYLATLALLFAPQLKPLCLRLWRRHGASDAAA